MLLTADAESNVTTPLKLEPVDVLKVAHHGSADPGLPALLTRLRPRIAAIEVGRATATAIRPEHPRGAQAGGADRAAHGSRRNGAAPRRRRPDVGQAMSPHTDLSRTTRSAGGRTRSVRPPDASRREEGHGTVTPPSGATIRLRPTVLSVFPRGKDSCTVKLRLPAAIAAVLLGMAALAAPAAHAATGVVISQAAFGQPVEATTKSSRSATCPARRSPSAAGSCGARTRAGRHRAAVPPSRRGRSCRSVRRSSSRTRLGRSRRRPT